MRIEENCKVLDYYSHGWQSDCSVSLFMVNNGLARKHQKSRLSQKRAPRRLPSTLRVPIPSLPEKKDGEKVERHKLKATKVVIKGSRIYTLDKDDRELYVSDFRMQPHEKGFYITMESIQPPRPGISAIGLMQKKGKTVRLIYAFPDSEPPQDFQTVKGQHMFVLKRVDQSEDVRKVDAIPVN